MRPDHSLTSKSYNTKKIYQPLEFHAISGKPSQFRVKNKMAFLSSAEYDVKYVVEDEEGTVLASGTIDHEVAAGDSVAVTIDMPDLNAVDAAKEVFIYFTATLRENKPWADAGYVVAEEKLQVKKAQKPMYDMTKRVAEDEELSVNDGATVITVKGKRFSATFSKVQGTLSSYSYDGVSMLSKPMLLNVFRLPTDNDGRQTSSWDAMGLRKLTVKGTSSEAIKSEDGKTVNVNCASIYTGQNGTTFDVNLSFIVCTDGAIMVNSFIRPSNSGAIMPKIGFRLEMPAAMEQLEWFGRGPWDSYRDRKEACLPAIYKSTVTNQQEDYILPQEHGTKQEVRWIALTNDEGCGLVFAAPDQMAASAVHFRPEDNYTDRNNRSRHTYQFKTCTTAVVSLDAVTRGLGNASCGPDVMEKYELKAANTAFRFIIIPLTSEVKAANEARADMPVCQPVSCERQTNGRIKMSTPTKNATIYYSINGEDYQKYTSTVLHNDACTVKAYCSLNGMMDSPVMSYNFDMFINRSSWKLVSVDSQHGGNEARLAFDGNTNTFWHTEYQGSEPTCPHTLIVDMLKPYWVTAFTYLSRQDGNQNGMVKAYEVYLSTDGETWGSPVVSGEFKNTTALQIAPLKTATVGRYLKFVAKSEINGRAWTSAAEIGIQASGDATAISTPQATSASSSEYYDLQGRKLSSIQNRKGIFIQNGKKIMH